MLEAFSGILALIWLLFLRNQRSLCFRTRLLQVSLRVTLLRFLKIIKHGGGFIYAKEAFLSCFLHLYRLCLVRMTNQLGSTLNHLWMRKSQSRQLQVRNLFFDVHYEVVLSLCQQWVVVEWVGGGPCSHHWERVCVRV